MKRALSVLMCLCLMCAGCVAAYAAPGEGEMYTEEVVNPDTGQPIYAWNGNTAPMDGAFFTLGGARVFRWAPGETQPVPYCDLPPALPYYSWENLSEEAAEQLAETVTQIAQGDDVLWAFNEYALRIGTIDESGVRWLPIALDKGVMPPEYTRAPRVSRCWVRDGQFEFLADMADYERGEWMSWAVFRFDLDTGAGSMVRFPGANMICPYKSGSYLAYTAAYDENRREVTGTLSIVDGTGAWTPLPIDIAGADYAIGGLSYDEAADRICYAHQGEIWASVAGAPFESVGYLPVAAVYDNAEAWLLPGDLYAIVSGGLYVRSVDPQHRPKRALRLHGVWSDETYTRFVKAHPDVPAIIMEYNEPRAADIAEAIRNGTCDVDVFAMNLDPSWRALVEKDYVADLSASAKLAADVARMYPTVQEALLDDAGRLMGYPVTMFASPWSVNERLWEEFAMGPLPTTYDQLLDYWLRWDAEFAPDRPELAFMQGGYDWFSIVNTIVTAYILRYERPGEPLDLTAPLLRGLLEKAERIDFGDWAERIKNGEMMDEYNVWINRPALFSLYGQRGLTSNPEETTFYSPDTDDVQRRDYLDSALMLPPVFVEGEEPRFEGHMQVLFANPASPNLDLAMAYIEGAVGANAEVEYMTHPDLNEPREVPDFERLRQRYQTYRDEQAARLESMTNPLDRRDAQIAVDYYDRWLADAENNKWQISPGAIRTMRAFLPFMRLRDRTVILAYEEGGMEQLYELLYRYVEGQLTLDDFLRELNNRMRMVVLEGR